MLARSRPLIFGSAAASALRRGPHPVHAAAPKSAASGREAGASGPATELRKNPDLYSQVDSPGAEDASVGDPAAAAPAAAPAHGLPLRHKPEVLSPAGGWPQLRAAVENGADAVYFGLSDFNARARAANFTPEELPEVMAYLHGRGCKGYLVLNVLIYDGELAALEARVRAAAAAGVDALIVQDVGAVALARAAAPGLPVHGSTQMSITSAEGALFAAGLGVERVVVGRELSVREIGRLAAGAPGVEVEAFVHGALCVSYSGQCFSSEAWGGRSANRGQCAQACRLPYGLIVDGSLRELVEQSYVLSPQDLAAVELVPELVAAGVGCLKIEGRLKGPEYVALTTQVYRRAVDAAWEGRAAAAQLAPRPDSEGGAAGEASAAAGEAARLRLSGEEWRDLEQVFARGQDAAHRGLTPGFLEGAAHQRLVRGRAPRHRGTLLGTVLRVGRDGGVAVKLACPVKRGDGVVFDAGRPEGTEQGGQVYEIKGAGGQALGEAPQGAAVELSFGRGQVDARAVAAGQLVWRTKDAALDARLHASYQGLSAAALRRLPVAVEARVAAGRPLVLTLRDEEGHTGSAETDVAAVPATGRPIGATEVERAVGQYLGGGEDALAVATFEFVGEEGAELFLPAAAIKDARRRAVSSLQEARRRDVPTAVGLAEEDVLPGMLAQIRAAGATGAAAADASVSDRGGAVATAPTLRVLCRSKAQVDAALALPWLTEVVLDFLEVQGLKEACAAVQAAGKRAVVATPRILKPDEQRLWLFYLRLGADALLLRSAGLLQQLMAMGGPGAAVPGADPRIPALEGDFSLNAANALSADLLLRAGIARLAPTHDCNAAQLQGMARILGGRAAQLEVILHQHLPIFHTEHCVFCRFLSSGSDYRDCGHPCEAHSLHLRDDSGRDHLVLADMGCRNTVFNAQAQSGLPYLRQLLDAGVGTFRIELVDEPAEFVGPLLEGYRAAIEAVLQEERGGEQQQQQQQGRSRGRQRRGGEERLWEWLQGLPDANGRAHGVGLGSLEVRAERRVEDMKPTAASLR